MEETEMWVVHMQVYEMSSYIKQNCLYNKELNFKPLLTPQ